MSAEPQVCSTAVMPMRGAKVPRIGGDGEQRLRRRPEQDIVDHRLVLECDLAISAGTVKTTWK